MLKFLLWLTARLPVEEIAHQGVKFMERYYVVTAFGWRVYIHRFIGSDPDGVHDHPWRFGASLILSGWYYEQRRERIYTRRWFNVVNGDTFHRIIVPAGQEAWSLFAHNARCKEWGFLRLRVGNLIRANNERRVMTVINGPFTIYEPHNTPAGHSTWHLTAPKGRDLRKAA